MVLGSLIYDLFIVLGIAFYFLPTIVALSRRSEKTLPIVAINVLLSWSVIGWIVALTMAFGSPSRPRA